MTKKSEKVVILNEIRDAFAGAARMIDEEIDKATAERRPVNYGDIVANIVRIIMDIWGKKDKLS